MRSKDIKIDPNYYGNKDEEALENALYAKFTQNIDLKNVLLNTQKAKLIHFQGTSPPIQSDTLMLVRNRIINESKNS